MKVKILCDSTCDASQEILKQYDLEYIPLVVNINDEERLDTISITNNDILEYVKKTGKLPKTAARSIEDYKEFFKKYYNNGCDIVLISLSQQLSVSYNNACAAAEEIDKNRIFVVDGRVLSTGSLLLAISGTEMANEGKSAKEIADALNQRSYNTQVSFVVDNLEYLRKGGRCSMLALLGANLLKIKPKLQLLDGKIVSTERYRGKMDIVIKKYIDDTLSLYNNPDTTRCFLTHADASDELINDIKNYVVSKNIFKEVLITTAASTIFSHCGKGTFGILYINDGGIF